MDAAALPRPSRGALALAVSLGIIFRAEPYDPSFGIPVAGTSVDVSMADLAILTLVLLAVHRVRSDSNLKQNARILWVGAAFCALIGAATLYGRVVSDTYPFAANVVSAATFSEYALLALASAVLVRRRVDVFVVLAAFTLLAIAAALWGTLQFVGAVNEFEGKRPWQRETSFLGIHDYAAVAGATIGIGFAFLATGLKGPWRQLAWTAAVAGCFGVILAASMTTVAATVLCAAAAIIVGAHRRLLNRSRAIAIVVLTCIAIVGAVGLRAGDVAQFVRFLGGSASVTHEANVETGSQRAVLSYIGMRMFLDHPFLGVGWRGSELEANFAPYLDDARKRFPEVSPEAFPSSEHPWGIQNAYIQAGADMGIVGFLLAVGVVLGGLLTAFAWMRDGSPEVVAFSLVALFWLIVSGAEWAALGLVSGNPTGALLWIGLGAAVTWASTGARGAIASDPKGVSG